MLPVVVFSLGGSRPGELLQGLVALVSKYCGSFLCPSKDRYVNISQFILANLCELLLSLGGLSV